QRPQALLTMLYRSTDRLCRRGAPMNLAHSASFDSDEKYAPSKPGIKHLGTVEQAASCGHELPCPAIAICLKRRVVVGLPGGFGLGDVDRAKLVACLIAHPYQPSSQIVVAGLQIESIAQRIASARAASKLGITAGGTWRDWSPSRYSNV
ncbi:hypothetical protein, partial [Mesorhizobium sp. LNJC398B00]|uniref:hypothetical protein n=1 Tax=Mesorhizobium sp. LNJC398B00 TaxID=1287276 RepID=UPI001AEC64D0